MNKKLIPNMNYADFVAFIGQPNTPPGGMGTIDKWLSFTNISQSSHILDLACSTGFSSRAFAQKSGCTGVGIDISTDSINEARKKADALNLSRKLHYVTGDATSLPFKDNYFSHVLGGCNFAFIQGRDVARKECARVLVEEGKLLVSNFYYHTKPSEELLDKVKESINFRPSGAWTWDWWQEFYRNDFTLVKSEKTTLEIFDEEYIQRITSDFIFHESPNLIGKPKELKDACYERLCHIRKILNEHRKYQGYSIEVWEANV